MSKLSFLSFRGAIMENMSDMYTPPKIPAELLARLSGDVNAFHSSAYAQEANGSRIGSTSVSSFADRIELEKNRQAVRSYRNSAIGSSAFSRQPGLQAGSRGSIMSSSRPTSASRPTGFREPPSRPYNPYS
jgi:hypothetical protein